MTWKQQLRQLEQAEQFEDALVLMEKTIQEDRGDVDRYIFMLYFLADLIMEPHSRMTNDQGIRHYWNEAYQAFAKKIF